MPKPESRRKSRAATTSGIYVIGAGGHARVVLATARRLGLRPAGVFDDDSGKRGRTLDGVEVLGPVASMADHPRLPAVIAIGDNRVRARLARELDQQWLTLVHPAATVEEGASIGQGTVVMAGAVVQTSAVVGSHVIINTCASVDHDCSVGDFCHVAPGAHLAGGVTLEEGVLRGIGSAVVTLRRVGRWSTVGAGAAVVSDLAGDTVAVGVPARPLTRRPK
jgi:sugar O-acyltransferase (sialic acid O-acetyltransferase NeuD family)